MHGRTGKKDQRGSAEDRASRKRWMLWKYGDSLGAECVHCGVYFPGEQLQQDRIIPGGPYRRSNIQPSCGPCNVRRGDSPVTPFRLTA